MATAPEPPDRSRPEMHANRFRASWRTELLAAVEDISNQTNWLQYEGSGPKSQELLLGIRSQLDSARLLLAHRRGNTRMLVLAHVHAAQLDLLRLAPASYVRASMTDLWTQAQRSLAANDPRLARLDFLRQKADSGEFTDDDKDEVLFCLRGAYQELRRSEARLDTFRDVVLLAAGTLLALVGVVGIVGLLDPGTFPVCFSPEAGGAVSIVCPSHSSEAFSVGTTTNIEDVVRATVASTDVFFVMFLGLVGAALSAANSIRGLRATAGPYSISVALAALKLSTGALIALIGIMLINAGLVPGLKGFESSAEIIAWALIFGYSQQLFTSVVDRQAQSVIEQSNAPRTSAT